MTNTRKNKMALLYGVNDVRVEECDIPALKTGEVLVKVEAATTCGTDLKTFKRGGHPQIIKSLPSPFGHEMTGTVVEVAEGVADFSKHDRVVVANSAPCHECYYCKKEKFNLCDDIQFINGAYAQYLTVPARFVKYNTHRIPDDLPFEKAVLAEPLACVLYACKKINVQENETVVVIGDGPMSFLFNQVINFKKARSIVVGLDPQRLEWAKQSGAAVVMNTAEVNVAQEINRITDGFGADVAIEAVGLPETWEQAMALVSKGGRVLCYGGCAKGTKMSVDTYRLHYDEITLLGTFHYTPQVMDEAIELLRHDSVDTSLFTSEVRGLEDLQKIFMGKDLKPALKYLIRASSV
ncbi:MAG: alcohol dehydrogenase catalytic domain-containing protein [bacterium]